MSHSGDKVKKRQRGAEGKREREGGGGQKRCVKEGSPSSTNSICSRMGKWKKERGNGCWGCRIVLKHTVHNETDSMDELNQTKLFAENIITFAAYRCYVNNIVIIECFPVSTDCVWEYITFVCISYFINVGNCSFAVVEPIHPPHRLIRSNNITTTESSYRNCKWNSAFRI